MSSSIPSISPTPQAQAQEEGDSLAPGHAEDRKTCVANVPHVIMGKVIDVKRAADGKKKDNEDDINKIPITPRGTELRTSSSTTTRTSYLGRDRKSYNRGEYTPHMENGNNNQTPDDPRKVFIGGIPMSVDKDRLINMLSHYGNVIDCDIMYDKNSGRSRGFGRATFSKVEEAQLAIMQGGLAAEGAGVEIKPLMRLIDKGGGGGNDKKRIRSHLSQYGKVVDVRIYHDKAPPLQQQQHRDSGGAGYGGHKGFGYAVMSTPMEAQAACKGGNKNYIDAKWVQIKPFCALNDDTQLQQQGQLQGGGASSLSMPAAAAAARRRPPPPLPRGSGMNSIPLGLYRNTMMIQDKYLSTSPYARQGYKATLPQQQQGGGGGGAMYRGGGGMMMSSGVGGIPLPSNNIMQ
ncbi:hypothetical protein FOL47_010478 [Perkinsus chesapeaki]|uniref:RRM domain-containing protein n=1 Tax=Perkinsus chesapeaki TaxID=330153 RepID=A0A7J6L466_PERCH|nr:hypothetical protein FOL47_010478 [Perkinsus chesapeaki]